MKKLTLRLLTLALLSACGTTPTPIAPTHLPAAMPGDFQLAYEWTSGAIEHYYRYTLILSADTAGEISFMPNYPSAEPPVWVEQFSLDENLLPSYYETLYNAGIFNAPLSQAEEMPAGGHTSQMSVVAYGQSYEIPYNFDDPENQKTIYRLYDEIESLIPQTIMDSFMAQRETYIETYEGGW